MKNEKKFFIAAVIFLTLIFVAAQNAWPDFGNFSGNSDYDSGGRSSSGSGYSSHSSSSSSSGSYTRRSSSYGGSNFSNGFNALSATSGILGGSDFDDIMGIIVVFVLVGIFFLLINMKKKPRKAPLIINANQSRILKPMSEYLALDPNFDGEKIENLIANLYIQMQETWHAKDISPLRPYFTDEFYNQMDKQLDEFRKNNRTDYAERVAVLNVHLIGWRQSKGRDYITLSLNSRIVSYILDDFTGELISGDKNKEKFMEYELELTRKSGEFTTPEGSEIKTETCPHCGAPVKLNASAKCEYCGSVITAVNTDWAVCAMRGISQKSNN